MFIKELKSGIGINDERIHIFTVYGQSTKRGDTTTYNGEAKGSWGLGSKCPYTISDHFFITTIFNDALKNKNIKIISISRHDTSLESINMFKKAFPDEFVELLVGKTIKI